MELKSWRERVSRDLLRVLIVPYGIEIFQAATRDATECSIKLYLMELKYAPYSRI